jgi:hypothetical protein
VVLLWLVRLVRRARSRRSVGFLLVAALLSIALIGNAVCFYAFERAVQPELGWGDALWYSVISIATIGYGDFAPTTLGARLGTVFFMRVRTPAATLQRSKSGGERLAVIFGACSPRSRSAFARRGGRLHARLRWQAGAHH